MAKVAVVGDDASVGARVSAVLRDQGHEVLPLAGIREALAALLPSPPDLLLLPATLPDGSGIELVARLRSRHSCPYPIVVTSPRVEDRVQTVIVGATQHVLTPVDPERIAALATDLLKRDALDGLQLPRSAEGLAFGRYRVRGALGAGSYGVVLDAWDVARGRPVALKVLSLDATTSDDAARFLREARVLSGVDDEHVVGLLDAGATDGRAFYAMRRVDGPTLDGRVRIGGPLTERETLWLVRGLARALAALEPAEIVHRDIKPRNVILEDGACERPVLIDFGLAKPALERGLTAPDTILGTPGYIAPEVVAGAPADARSDLFSVGVVGAYAMQGGELFPGLRSMALMVRMASDPVPIPDRASPPLRALLSRMTAHDPARRPTAAETLDALDALEVAQDVPTRARLRPAR